MRKYKIIIKSFFFFFAAQKQTWFCLQRLYFRASLWKMTSAWVKNMYYCFEKYLYYLKLDLVNFCWYLQLYMLEIPEDFDILDLNGKTFDVSGVFCIPFQLSANVLTTGCAKKWRSSACYVIMSINLVCKTYTDWIGKFCAKFQTANSWRYTDWIILFHSKCTFFLHKSVITLFKIKAYHWIIEKITEIKFQFNRFTSDHAPFLILTSLKNIQSLPSLCQ